MPTIALIAAMDRNRLIGAGNRMPWHLPPDLARFRALTTGHPVLMGRRTHESIGRPLPNRRNVVISRQADYAPPGAERAHSLDAALALCADAPTVFIIGGGEIYRQALDRATHLYLTEVRFAFTGDTWFPAFDRTQWKVVREEVHHHAGDPAFAYAFADYERA